MLILFLSVVAGLFKVNFALAEGGEVYISQPTGGSTYTTQTTFIIGQTFTAPTFFNATTITLSLFRSSTVPTGCALYLYTTNNNLPTTEILHVNFSAAALPVSPTDRILFNISIPSGTILNYNEKYWIGITSIEHTSSIYLGCGYSNTDVYNGGNIVYGSSFPANTPQTAQDMIFIIYGYPAEPIVSGYSYTFQPPIYDVQPQEQINNAHLFLTSITGITYQVTVNSQTSYTFNMTQLRSVSWNYSTALDITRTIEFLPTDGTVNGQTVFPIFVASPHYSSGGYLFNIVDYTGSAQYLQLGRDHSVLERKSLMISGTVEFSMYQGITYTLTIVGTEGTFAQTFMAGSILSTNVLVLEGSFGNATTYGQDTTFKAIRQNSTCLNVYFNDLTDNVAFFNFTIYRQIGTEQFEAYSGEATNEYFPLNALWNNAEASASYTVKAWAYDTSNTLLQSWTVNIPTAQQATNPWEALLDPLASQVATLPGSAVLPTGFNVAQLPAAIIVAFVLAVFSFKNHDVGCLLAWVIAAIMVGLGWFTVSLPAFGFALFLSILIAFSEGKKTEREL